MRWFDLDYEWVEEHFRTCELDFIKILKNIRGQDMKISIICSPN